MDFGIGVAENDWLIETMGWERADGQAPAARKRSTGRPRPTALRRDFGPCRHTFFRPHLGVTCRREAPLAAFSAFAPILFDALQRPLAATRLARAMAGTAPAHDHISGKTP